MADGHARAFFKPQRAPIQRYRWPARREGRADSCAALASADWAPAARARVCWGPARGRLASGCRALIGLPQFVGVVRLCRFCSRWALVTFAWRRVALIQTPG